jgi:hypothetical protein
VPSASKDRQKRSGVSSVTLRMRVPRRGHAQTLEELPAFFSPIRRRVRLDFYEHRRRGEEPYDETRKPIGSSQKPHCLSFLSRIGLLVS